MRYTINKKPSLQPVMKRLTQTFISCLAVALVSLFVMASWGYAQEETLELAFKEKTLTANIREASLGEIIEKIKAKTGIWFKFHFKGESVLEETVSVEFNNLSVEKGFDRIFSFINYSLIFDRGGNITGVFLLGKPGKSRVVRRRYTPRRRYRR
jgi:hypothetical protein